MIKHWIKALFELNQPIGETYGSDTTLLWLHAISGFLIAITFCIIGSLCLALGKKNIERNSAYTKRVIMTRLFGLFLFTCGLSRGVDAFCLWWNLGYFSAIFKLATGIAAFFAILYIPVVAKAIQETRTIEEVQQSLKDTNKKIDKLEEIKQKRD